MNKQKVLVFSILAVLGSGVSSAHAARIDPLVLKAVKPSEVQATQVLAGKPGVAEEESLYLVRFKDAPVATYRGNVPGLKATSLEVTRATKLNARSSEARAYRAYLESRQAQALSNMELRLSRSLQVTNRYFYGNNGMALMLTPSEAAEVGKMPEVEFIQPNFKRELQTDAGPAFIHAPEIWNGVAQTATQGEGIIVGVIDTGINPSNPSFADVGGDTYDHTNPWGAGNYVGVCDSSDPSYDATFPCNDKLIGAWGYAAAGGAGDPRDYDSHGSHTASTAAGNHTNMTVEAPTISIPAAISGVAPHANIIAYAACCDGNSLAAGIDQAIADGVDVINYSIGSTTPSLVWGDFDTVGFLNARTAGIFVAVSAGNAGPGANTVGSPADAPWLSSTGNLSHDRVFHNALVDMANGGTPPGDMDGQSMTAGYGPKPIVHAAGVNNGTAPDDGLCGTPFPAGTWANGEIVVCNRGTYDRVVKSANVAAGGAGGFVLANTDATGESLAADPHIIPSVHIGDIDGDVLRAWLASGSGHTATIAGTTKINDPAAGNIMNSTSSRGMNRALPDIIKPDIAAPGTNILAAVGVGDPNPAEWGLMSGTSMASPHVAGAGALLRSLYPSLTPAELQSLLMTTAYRVVLKENGVTPADPFDIGAGSLNLMDIAYGMAWLVLDESTANYNAANPSVGGTPRQLNIPSLGNQQCAGTCSWTRTVKSIGSQTETWTASVENPPGWDLAVSPSSFSLMPGSTQVVTITATATTLPTTTWQFGQVELSADQHAGQHFPVALAFVPPTEAGGTYVVTTSQNDASCDTGFGGYVNLANYGINPQASVVGDTQTWTAFTGQTPINFYGVNYTGVSFTDDGYLVFDQANNNGGQPWTPQNIPAMDKPNALLAAIWGDYEVVYEAPPTGSGVSLATNGPGMSIIEYDNLRKYGTTTVLGDVEIIVNSVVNDAPGAYEFVVAFGSDANSANAVNPTTLGIEAPGGTVATALVNNAAPPASLADLMVCYDYHAGSAACRDYWVLSSGTATAIETYEARMSILAGSAYSVGATGNVSMRASAGGTVQLYPGFRVANGGHLTVNVNDAGACPI